MAFGLRQPPPYRIFLSEANSYAHYRHLPHAPVDLCPSPLHTSSLSAHPHSLCEGPAQLPLRPPPVHMNSTPTSEPTFYATVDQKRVWLLLSGGIDSAACLSFYLSHGFTVECLHISFGQPSSDPELAAATRVADHYSVPLTLYRWSGPLPKITPGEIVGRNAFFLFASLLGIGDRSGLLAIGIHSGTQYFDCSPNFLHLMQAMTNGYCDGRIKLVAPFLEWSKQQIISFCQSHSVPIDLTYSCEKGTPEPCGSCLSCRDRIQLCA